MSLWILCQCVCHPKSTSWGCPLARVLFAHAQCEKDFETNQAMAGEVVDMQEPHLKIEHKGSKLEGLLLLVTRESTWVVSQNQLEGFSLGSCCQLTSWWLLEPDGLAVFRGFPFTYKNNSHHQPKPPINRYLILKKQGFEQPSTLRFHPREKVQLPLCRMDPGRPGDFGDGF